MQSGIYIDEEKAEINIFFGGKIGVATEEGTIKENGKEQEAYALTLQELEEVHDVREDLRGKPVKVLPLKIRFIFQDKNINSINVLIECLEHITGNILKKLCTTK